MHTSYNCFSEKGETKLPEAAELASYIQLKMEPIIFFDSCICLQIIKIVDYGKKATNIDLYKIITLKEHISKYPIKISPFFGLIELCIKNGEFDERKFWDFKYRIDFFEQIPLSEFKKFKYDFNKDYYLFREPLGTLSNPYIALEPSLKNSYCALLKLRSLAQKGLAKRTAEININDFLDWMVNVLDSVHAMEYKLALNIFGGNTIFRKMIGLDCKSSEVQKKIMGTCWDIFHSTNTSNSFRLFEMLGRNIMPFFLTSDGNLFNIFKRFSLTLIKDGGKDFTSSFILNSEFSFPHLHEDFLNRQNEKMINIFIDRRNRTYKFNHSKINNLITELENDNQILH